MASNGLNPQLENGYTTIAHDVMQLMASNNFSAYESRILWTVFRKTYGWKKVWAVITVRQFSDFTGLEIRAVSKALQRLIERGVLLQEPTGTHSRNNRPLFKYRFNKYYAPVDNS